MDTTRFSCGSQQQCYRDCGVFAIFVFVRRNKKDIMKTRLFKYIENFTTKNWKFSDKNSDIFHISAQNIQCKLWALVEPPHQGGSNEYPKSMFLSRNKKNTVYPCKPQFYYIKVGFCLCWGFMALSTQWGSVYLTTGLLGRLSPLSG